jgi:uncharacterized membrane protein
MKITKKQILLISIFILAFSLRLIALNQSLWLDEAIQAWSTTFSLKNLITGYMKGDFNPPLYHLILWGWAKLFGTSEIVLRLPSVFFGLGIVYFVYKISRSRLATILTAINPLLIYYSQEARMYSLAAFLFLASLYYFQKYYKTKSKRHKILYTIYYVLALLSHYLIWFTIPIFIFLTPFILLPVVFCLLPILPLTYFQVSGALGAASIPAWANLSAPTLKNLFLLPAKFVTGRIPFQIVYLPVVIIFWLLWFLPVLKKKISLNHFLLIFTIITVALFSLIAPSFTYFRFLFLVPLFIIGVTQGINLLPSKIKKITVCIVIFSSILYTTYYILNTNNHREDWRSLAAQLPLDSQIYTYPSISAPLKYYYSGSTSDLQNLPAETAKLWVGTIYTVPYAAPIFDPQLEYQAFLKDNGYQLIQKQYFNSVPLEVWQKN